MQRYSRRADKWVEVRETSCPYDGKLSLKMDEPHVGQRHEDVEMKLQYYHIIIFPERNRNFSSRNKETGEYHSNIPVNNYYYVSPAFHNTLITASALEILSQRILGLGEKFSA